MTRRPGSSSGDGKSGGTPLVCRRISSAGTNVAPICCVMPPASPRWTLVLRILSRIFVLPARELCAGNKLMLIELNLCPRAPAQRQLENATQGNHPSCQYAERGLNYKITHVATNAPKWRWQRRSRHALQPAQLLRRSRLWSQLVLLAPLMFVTRLETT